MALNVFEQLVFVIIVDLEERIQQLATATKPFSYTPTTKAAKKPQDLLRPALLKHLESCSIEGNHQRWVRQLMFLLRSE